jgi:ATP-binding cassette subfamily B protein
MFSELSGILKIGLWVAGDIRRNQRRTLLLAMLIMLLAAGLTNLPAVLLGRMVDKIVANPHGFLPLALPTLVWIAVAICTRELLNVSRKYVVENTCTHVQKEKTVAAVQHLLRLDFNSLPEGQRMGAIQGRMHRSIEGYIKLIKLTFLDLLPALFTCACALYVVGMTDYVEGALMAAVIPIGLTLTLWQMKTQKGIRIDLLRAKEEIDGRIIELLAGLEYLRAADTVDLEVGRVESSCEGLRAREIRHHFSMSLFDAAKYLNEGAFQILVLLVALWLASTHHASVGNVLTYAVLFGAVVAPLREIHRILDEGHESAIRTQDLIDLLAWKEDPSYSVSTDGLSSASINQTTQAIDFCGVSFSYPNAAKASPGLENLSVSIENGEMVGIAGASGSGKSTFLRAVLGLIRSDRGQVRIFGLDVRSLSRKSIAELITFLPQSPFLFNGSVFENIAYGCGEVSMASVRRAAQMAQIDDEIMQLSDGYSHKLSERAGNLSGGQRQRIALARAFLKNAPILILDEATSALDSVNEEKVQVALKSLRVGRTVLVVSHKIRPLRDTDRLLVFRSGKIIESGSFDELKQTGGTFYSLVSASGINECQNAVGSALSISLRGADVANPEPHYV